MYPSRSAAWMHRLGVLVHPHEEVHLVAPQPPVAGDGVGAHLFQRVPQVGIAVGVVDGGGQVKLGTRGSLVFEGGKLIGGRLRLRCRLPLASLAGRAHSALGGGVEGPLPRRRRRRPERWPPARRVRLGDAVGLGHGPRGRGLVGQPGAQLAGEQHVAQAFDLLAELKQAE